MCLPCAGEHLCEGCLCCIEGGGLTFASTFGDSQRTELVCLHVLAHLLQITYILH